MNQISLPTRDPLANHVATGGVHWGMLWIVAVLCSTWPHSSFLHFWCSWSMARLPPPMTFPGPGKRLDLVLPKGGGGATEWWYPPAGQRGVGELCGWRRPPAVDRPDRRRNTSLSGTEHSGWTWRSLLFFWFYLADAEAFSRFPDQPECFNGLCKCRCGTRKPLGSWRLPPFPFPFPPPWPCEDSVTPVADLPYPDVWHVTCLERWWRRGCFGE